MLRYCYGLTQYRVKPPPAPPVPPHPTGGRPPPTDLPLRRPLLQGQDHQPGRGRPMTCSSPHCQQRPVHHWLTPDGVERLCGLHLLLLITDVEQAGRSLVVSV